ncbi:efflux RND transporter periplasmic adaptor subunit [Vibrio sp. JPW-9-11-11]|uniref:efflux RND transporter periplasmic adaptor subunit n=1 Tax=Vibrio sp. JPW-9-11-11 TaxID=1416532 RepID=UPI00159406D1|nr:efflux RND transporter periplasmic adaptor subunit [Vibrio sp. JPW-9-11-11]NVD09027.1 efflux RND transporter periplasmic adaptor subunit [Vibrio sp. JPW-9-11-11]
MTNIFNKKILIVAVTFVSAGLILAALGYNSTQIALASAINDHKADEPDHLSEPANYPQVEVKHVAADRYQAQVTGYGETRSRFQLNYSSQVSGRVESISTEFEEGKTLKKGELLLRLNSIAYEQAVASAKYDLEQAQQELLEELRQSAQARSEWERSGLEGQPDSPLVLREPQVASAKAKLEKARKSLAKAKDDLEKTEIRAPFDCVVIRREVQPGSYINSGDQVATLYSTDRVEIEIPLSEQQWLNLPRLSSANSWHAEVTDMTGSHQWRASVERGYQYVEQKTRQRSLVLVIDAPLQQDFPLFPGTFVRATIQGAEVDDLWQLPASALSQQGEVWLVDEQGLLKKAAADKVFEYREHIYIKPLENHEQAQVVKRPLNSFKVGMKVTPYGEVSSPSIATNKVKHTLNKSEREGVRL